MSTIFPLDRTIKLTPENHGNIAELGPAGGNPSAVGVFELQIVPSADFVGALDTVCRVVNTTVGHNVPEAPFVACPYKAVYLNGAAPAVPYGFALDPGTNLPVPITGPSIIHVPSNGLSIGLLVACTAGFVWVYLQRLNGPSAT